MQKIRIRKNCNWNRVNYKNSVMKVETNKKGFKLFTGHANKMKM